jgi:hypothetical protein
LPQSDRISSKRESRIGTIEVIRYRASYVKQEYRKTVDTVFNQATKKDAYKVTAGKYTMSTTKKGKLIHSVKPYDVQLKKLWRIGRECGKLTVHYRMGHTLEGMGVQLRLTDWTKIVSRKSTDSRASSTSSVELQGCSPTDSPPASVVQMPSQSTDSAATTSNDQTSSPPSLSIAPSVVSLSPLEVLRSPPTVFLAQGSTGLQCFPGLIMPIKTEPEDIKPDITLLQKCVSTHN